MTTPSADPAHLNRPFQIPPGQLELYNATSQECSALVTRRYSTSFSLAIRSLNPELRGPICAIYGFVRLADEIVDSFLEQDRQLLLTQFTEQTWQAIELGISINPILQAYQQVVRQYNIPPELTRAFLYSMEMDLTPREYTLEEYGRYIYGSAEVVGLMCLRVFCNGEDALYQKLESSARSLGAAFQKVNFLRDIQADHDYRGRIYFPGADLTRFDDSTKEEIETDIEADFAAAYEGIIQLPHASRLGVYLAYRYYRRLFAKIKTVPPAQIMSQRIRVANSQKIWLLARSYVRHQLNIL
jgi:15-cis-phytoene synthase